MNQEEFKRRTKQLALRVIRMVEVLPASRTADIISKQLLRSATSVGANYRAACRGRSDADMVAKLRIVLEEADETLYWMELLVEAKIVKESNLTPLMSETNEIVAMTVASLKTLEAKLRQAKTKKQSDKQQAER